MNAVDELDPTLLRQMKRLGLVANEPVTDAEVWSKFVRAVNAHYRHLADDRVLLTRSMELSTNEMLGLKQRVEAQRDQLRSAIVAIADALGMFGALASSNAGSDASHTDIAAAKISFSARLAAIFGDSHSSDTSAEFSGIHANLARLADALIRLLSETAEKASLKKELEIASTVQKMLVPEGDVIDRAHVRIAGHFRPAAECGGDWWGIYDLPDQRVLTVIGDVTGHGIASAIITGAAKAACDLACKLTKERLEPSLLLQLLNSTIHETGRRQLMMTCSAGAFDPKSGKLTLANAGHPFPFVVRGGTAQTLVVNGQPLGASDHASYDQTVFEVRSRDVLVWFTDGIVECEGEGGEQFSDRRLRAICQRAAAGGAAAVRDAVVAAVNEFHRGAQQDDFTLVVAECK